MLDVSSSRVLCFISRFILLLAFFTLPSVSSLYPAPHFFLRPFVRVIGAKNQPKFNHNLQKGPQAYLRAFAILGRRCTFTLSSLRSSQAVDIPSPAYPPPSASFRHTSLRKSSSSDQSDCGACSPV